MNRRRSFLLIATACFALSGGQVISATLTGSKSAQPTSVSLSTEGSADWSHWGLNSSTDWNHKSGTTAQISNFARVGTGTVSRYTDGTCANSWTGGTPTASVTSTTAGVYTASAGNGFQITVPADTTARTLKIYCGVWKSQGKLEATLSDGSAPAVIDTSHGSTTGSANTLWTLNYAANSTGQTLTVKWTVQTSHDTAGNGTVGWQAATLSVATVNSAPSVSLATPASGSTYTAPASVPMSATASDSDGTISKVEFFQGSSLVGTDTTSPYAVTWSGVAAGSYSLTAKATDNAGAASTSSAASITVNSSSTSSSGNTPPTVSISSPGNGAAFTAPASVSVSATAADSNGSVSKVDFIAGTTSIGTDTSSPYAITWGNVAAGSYSLTARATDNGGAVTTSAAVNITVNSSSSSSSSTSPIDTSSFIGGSGTGDQIRKTEIQSDGTIVLAGMISSANPQGKTPILLNGATSSTSGAIVRLSADGRTVMSVTRIASEIWDLSLDSSDNIYVAARSAGLFKLNSTASSVVWQKAITADRVDAAPNGYSVALHGSWSSTDGWTAGGAGTVYVYDASGNQLGSFVGHNRTQDVAIDSATQSVYLIGWQNKTIPEGHSQGPNQPVQVSYIKSTSYSGTQKWKSYDWPGDQLADHEADNRGVCIEIGGDGYLYAGFTADGGDHLLRQDPFNLAVTAPLAGGDKYHQFYNSASERKSVFGKYNVGTGSIIVYQQLCARLDTGKANSAVLRHFTADQNSRIYVVGNCASGGGSNNTLPGLPFTFNPIPSGEYGGGSFLLVMTSDFKTRLLCTRASSSGGTYGVAARVLSGRTTPNVVCGGYWSSGTLYLKNAIQGSSSTTNDGFFQVKVNMP